jgi:glycerophosphoryl diester phosphodiesterase
MGAESNRLAGWQRRSGQGPRVLGHRGASAHVTENTLAAFQRALADGADGVELDVQRCRSGEVVVFHDDDLARLGDRPGRIQDLPLAALREVPLRGGGRIPTLAEALEACGPGAMVNVEIKCPGLGARGCARLVAAVAEVVARAGAARAGARVLVSSFSPAAVWLWRRRCAWVPCGLLFEPPRPFHRPWPLRMPWTLPVLAPDAVHPAHALCTPESVQRWHRRGYAVNVWTVDDSARMSALADMGVDAIITNDPRAARLTLGSAGG